jgi:hypothetical protein
MAVVIQESTASMTADYVGAKPGVSYARKGPTDFAVLHQTRNAGRIIAHDVPNEAAARAANAIKIAASISVRASRLEDIKETYMFHLLQLIWKPVDYALYAGRTAADGSLKFDYVAPPFYPAGSPILLDASDRSTQNFPYVENDLPKITPTTPPDGWRVSVETSDHPYVTRPLRFPNFATASARGRDDKTNYLYEVGRTMYFFTAFVARDVGTSELKIFGFICWKSVLRAQIRWTQDGNPVPETLVTSYFTSEDFQTGTPNEEAKRLMLNLPIDDASDTYNAIETASIHMMRNKSNSPAVQANRTWSSSVPATLFAR